MLANLWDVTDKDIDPFLTCLLSSWLSDEPAKDQRKLPDVFPKVRAAFHISCRVRIPSVLETVPKKSKTVILVFVYIR